MKKHESYESIMKGCGGKKTVENKFGSNDRISICGKDYVCELCEERSREKIKTTGKFTVGDKVIISESKREGVRRIIGKANSEKMKIIKGKIKDINVNAYIDYIISYMVEVIKIDGCTYHFGMKEEDLTLEKKKKQKWL